MPSPTPRLSRGYSLRQKFALAALMTHVMALVIGYAIAMWVRAERLDPSVEPFLLAGFYLLLALCAVLDALWADEVMFAGSFRITALQGKSVESLHADSDLEDMVATTVCRHAVKANDDLHPKELEKLLEDLLDCELPFCCPHGRPTLVQISFKELEKKFGRVV